MKIRPVILCLSLMFASSLAVGEAVAKDSKKEGSDSGKIYVFAPGQPSVPPKVILPPSQAKAKVPAVPLISTPNKGPAPSRTVILDKATPKD
ncbi:MAG: hypothetical protein NTZ90_03330 [Proteobacteria bacterium]|nr:hypothetical protein [Pseudomonadota bacterium]